jgi:hypothetical protein
MRLFGGETIQERYQRESAARDHTISQEEVLSNDIRKTARKEAAAGIVAMGLEAMAQDTRWFRATPQREQLKFVADLKAFSEGKTVTDWCDRFQSQGGYSWVDHFPNWDDINKELAQLFEDHHCKLENSFSPEATRRLEKLVNDFDKRLPEIEYAKAEKQAGVLQRDRDEALARQSEQFGLSEMG